MPDLKQCPCGGSINIKRELEPYDKDIIYVPRCSNLDCAWIREVYFYDEQEAIGFVNTRSLEDAIWERCVEVIKQFEVKSHLSIRLKVDLVNAIRKAKGGE